MRRRGNPGVAPLWAKGSDLDLLAGLGVDPAEPWVVLKKADAFLELGKVMEAQAVLLSMELVPEGLRDIREKMLETASNAPSTRYEPGGGKAERLKAWLASVRQWREKTGI